jgi:hypothetical protein
MSSATLADDLVKPEGLGGRDLTRDLTGSGSLSRRMAVFRKNAEFNRFVIAESLKYEP